MHRTKRIVSVLSVLAGLSALLAAPLLVASATSITMGDTTLYTHLDSGNGGLLLVQDATLSQTATLQSLSFYVKKASGSLRLGVYDATGPSGGPGTLMAQTNSFTPVAGWNTQNVVTPVSLPAGNYWLAYTPSSSSLSFENNAGASGNYKQANFTFGAMPATFPTVTQSGATHWSFYATLNTSPDTQAPTVPTNLAATAVSSSQINLAWSASTDNVGVTGYQVFRGGVQIATTTTTSYSNTGLTASTTYSYTVTAFDAAGNISAQSSPASATTLPPPDTTPPSTPGNFVATPLSTTTISLSWTASTDNVGVAGYKVSRNGSPIATTTGTTINDTGLQPNTLYSYVVAAFDAAGNISAAANTSTSTLPLPPDTQAPSVPTGFSANAMSSSQINLVWNASTDNVGVAGYQVFRNGAPVATSTTTTYADMGLTASTTYSYSVTAFDASGNVSAQSSSASATTQPPVVGGTPTLVQHVSSSANPVGLGISGNNFKIPLPNAVGAGNVLILGITYPHGSTPTVTDNNGNTWPASPAVSADAGSGGYVSSIFVLPNAKAGLTTITVSFGAAVIPFEYTVSEFDNVATVSPVNGTSETANKAGTSVTTGSFTPGNNDGGGGNLVWNYYALAEIANGNPTSWVPGSGFTLLDADVSWTNKQGFPHASQYLVQTTAVPIDPSITTTGDSTDGFNAVAVALKAAGAGTPAPSGIHINKIIHQTSNVWPTSGTLAMQIPTTGNLLVLEYSSEAIGVTGITDSDGGTWNHVSGNATPGIWWSANRSADPNLVVTFHISGGAGVTQSVRFFDISGAAASPFDVSASIPDTDVSHQTTLNDAPDIAPTTANGLVIAALSLGQGPGLGFNSGAPSGAVFDFTTYSGEVDLDLMENADGLAHVYNSDTSAETWNWNFTSQSSNSASGIAVAFKAGSGGGGGGGDTTPPSVPTNLSATAVSTSTINLSWTVSTDNVGVTGYQVFRNSAQIATTTSTTYADSGLTASTTYSYTVTAFDAAGNVSAQSVPLQVTTTSAAPVTIGETNVLGNGSLLFAQSAELPVAATIQSLSFYVANAVGNLRLGIYDASGSGGGPGVLEAQTNSFVPVAGWNTAAVTAPVQLPAGYYWLAYLPSNSGLQSAALFGVGSYLYASSTFGAMPATFPAIAGQGTAQWPLYATLNP